MWVSTCPICGVTQETPDTAVLPARCSECGYSRGLSHRPKSRPYRSALAVPWADSKTVGDSAFWQGARETDLAPERADGAEGRMPMSSFAGGLSPDANNLKVDSSIPPSLPSEVSHPGSSPDGPAGGLPPFPTEPSQGAGQATAPVPDFVGDTRAITLSLTPTPQNALSEGDVSGGFGSERLTTVRKVGKNMAWKGHVRVDMSDRNPGDEGVVRCFKCLAERRFSVGARGGIYYTPWEQEGRLSPRCGRQARRRIAPTK